MSWAFAIVNNRLAEIFFDTNVCRKKKHSKVWGHCYVSGSEYKTKQEQKWIASDTKKYRFAYRDKKYRRIHQLVVEAKK